MDDISRQNHAAVPRREAVEVRKLVTVDEFEAYVRPGGRPVVIRGWMNNWRALSDWDFAFFKTRYGNDELRLDYGPKTRKSAVTATMSDYIDYIAAPEKPSALRRLQNRLGLRQPFYCTCYKPFTCHPELWRDFQIPPFVADWWPLLSDDFRGRHFPHRQGWVLISAEGAVSTMHIDSHHTITWLAQLRGRKHCYLFAPEDAEAVYGGNVDPARPDLAQYPRFAQATCHYCELIPGDMLFLPPDWWHHVVTVENSVTLSCNFVNHTNFGLYMLAAYGPRLREVLATLPDRPLDAAARGNREAGPGPMPAAIDQPVGQS